MQADKVKISLPGPASKGEVPVFCVRCKCAYHAIINNTNVEYACVQTAAMLFAEKGFINA